MALPKLDIDYREAMRSPANIITAIILLMGLVLLVIRFTQGIGGVSALDDNNPWGIWVAFDMLCGIALAAGGYTCLSAVYLFGMKQYSSAVRPALTSAFLGYLIEVVALTFDVGQPWRLPYPLFWSPGTTSVLFQVGLCVMVYLTVMFVEWSPALFEWLKWPKLQKLRSGIVKLTIPLVILGVTLAVLHQSALGAMYISVPGKLHPLWYSSLIPVFFFVSSAYAGFSMVILEGSVAHKTRLHHKMDAKHLAQADGVALGFGKAASFIMMGYLVIRIIDVALQNNWQYLSTGYGLLFIAELVLFVAFPAFLYAVGVREKRVGVIRLASLFAVLGLIFNRFIVGLFAFNWQLPSAERYFPSILEIGLSIFAITFLITLYRFIATFMPIMYEDPNYMEHSEGAKS